MGYTIVRPTDRDAWLKEREKGIGSSEATTLMGVNHYEDRFKLFQRKTHRIPPKESSEQMELGHHLEPAVASRFAEMTGAWIDPASVEDWIARDDEKPYLQVSPDRIWIPQGEEHTAENWRILECKTTGMSVDEDDIPSYWYCQLQYQMGVMGIRKGALAWISSFPVFNFGYKEIDFNPAYYNLVVQAIDEFWNNHIIPDVAPEPEALEDLRAKYNKTATLKGKTLIADDWMEEDFDELIRLKEAISENEKRKKELEAELEKAIMGYEIIYRQDKQTLIATRLPKTAKTAFNLDLFKEEYPELYEKYLEERPSVFNEALFKKEAKGLYKEYVVAGEEGEPEFKIAYPRKIASRKTESIF